MRIRSVRWTAWWTSGVSTGGLKGNILNRKFVAARGVKPDRGSHQVLQLLHFFRRSLAPRFLRLPAHVFGFHQIIHQNGGGQVLDLPGGLDRVVHGLAHSECFAFTAHPLRKFPRALAARRRPQRAACRARAEGSARCWSCREFRWGRRRRGDPPKFARSGRRSRRDRKFPPCSRRNPDCIRW